MKKNGFTLIEICVTIALFALGAVALAALQVFSIRGTAFNKESTTASALAQQAVEDFRNSGFGSAPSGCGTTTSAGMTIACNQSLIGASPYRYNDITVTVTWGSPAKNIRLYTTVAER